MTTTPDSRSSTRAAIVEAGARLLHDGGPAAMTTRGVADAAGVQPPTIYRLFGDKDGLLEAVAEHVMAGFVSEKTGRMAAAAAAGADPLEDLRHSWQQQIDFGLANPAVFRLLSDPDRARTSPAAQAGWRVLAHRVNRLATAGRLGVPEKTAVALIHASGVGVIQSLLATPVADRDQALPDAMLEAVLGRILADGPAETTDGPSAAAISLRAFAHELDALSVSEQHLLAEWLDRISTASRPPRRPAAPAGHQ